MRINLPSWSENVWRKLEIFPVFLRKIITIICHPTICEFRSLANYHRNAFFSLSPVRHSRPGDGGSLQPSAFSLSRSRRAFTMIEIAIAVGVIGFALVAIIGILPRGMNVQKDNREDTIVSQDAPYFLNAIRNGEMRTNNNILTGYVESINVNGTNYCNPILTNGPNPVLTNDMIIVGLLSSPEYDPRMMSGTIVLSNEVTAIVRAMTGSAVQQNGANAFTAFRYQLTVEIDPWNYTSSAVYNPYGNSQPAINQMIYMQSILHEARLRFAWPVLPNGNIGTTGRQTYRTMISSHLGLTNVPGDTSIPLWFFQPQSYTTNVYGP
jgi:type II secretory pathway pseudopilin PulG